MKRIFKSFESRQKRNQLKPGDVARVKISGEPVYILNTGNNGVVDTVRIRRAKVTRDGIEYTADDLVAGEVESVEESIDREFAEVLYRHKLSSGKGTKVEVIDIDLEEPGNIQ